MTVKIEAAVKYTAKTSKIGQCSQDVGGPAGWKLQLLREWRGENQSFGGWGRSRAGGKSVRMLFSLSAPCGDEGEDLGEATV